MKKNAFIFLLALLCGTARAQGSEPLSLIFESEPGTRLSAIFADGFESGDTSSLLDATGDGIPDLILTREDSDGNLLDILVLDVIAGLDTTVAVRDVPQTLGLAERDGMKIYGFADPDADGEPEAIFADDQEAVFSVDLRRTAIEWQASSGGTPLRLLGVTDLTGDGFEELILFLPDPRVVQVWSKP